MQFTYIIVFVCICVCMRACTLLGDVFFNISHSQTSKKATAYTVPFEMTKI